jgi:hypothetical protein
MKHTISRAVIGLTLFAATAQQAAAQSMELYVDSKTKQIFAEAGPGRVRLGKAIITTDPNAGAPVKPRSISVSPAAAPAPALSDAKWYDKFSIRGYTQLRYTSLWDHSGAEWFHPADRTVAPDQTFMIRRGRLILSGDASEHLFLYAQGELNGSPSDGDFATQLRDLYGDIAFDEKKEYRLRVGQSKVPYGYANLQSSQNRGPMERADAINSAAESERDIGAFMMWAPKDIRERYANLVRSGLKGSGDYGVLAVGAYSGQGPNRSDANDSVHTVVRAAYPFRTEGGQFFETGVQAYTGKFVPRTKAFTLPDSDEEVTPTFDADGVTDQRMGFSAVMYPQPIGFEAEWNFGRSPTLSDDYLTIDDESMQGGYIQANAKIDSSSMGTVFPFVRWQYFDGARKFGRNAPDVLINEWDFGAEWSPWKDVEFTAMYSRTIDRTNSNSFPYDNLTNGDRLALQVQINY